MNVLRIVKWLTILLQTTTTKILINGASGRRIVHAQAQELRQGDPISSLLFIIIVMDALTAISYG
jgi:hypothetical protein